MNLFLPPSPPAVRFKYQDAMSYIVCFCFFSFFFVEENRAEEITTPVSPEIEKQFMENKEKESVDSDDSLSTSGTSYFKNIRSLATY